LGNWLCVADVSDETKNLNRMFPYWLGIKRLPLMEAHQREQLCTMGSTIHAHGYARNKKKRQKKTTGKKTLSKHPHH